MSREKELAKNTIIISIGKMATQFVSFLLLPLYTAKLTTEEYGTVDLLNTYITLLIPIIIFQIEQALFRYLIDAREDKKEKGILISTTFITAIVQSIVFLIIFCIIAQFIQNDYKYFLATNVIATIFSSIMLQIARGLGNNKVYSIGSFITASSTIVLNVIFIVCFKLGAYGMLAASLISNIICSLFIVVDLKIYKYINIKLYNFEKLKTLWKYSFPLIPNALSWWIMGVSDRTIVTYFLGISKNGIYSVANKFPAIFSSIVTMFSLSWTESIAIHIKDKDSDVYISKTMDTVFKFFSSICFGIIACVPLVFSIIINKNYNEAYNHIPILIIGTLCNLVVILLSGIYISMKKTKKVAQTSIISATINIVIDLALINYIDLYAASISTAIAYFIMMIIRMIDIRKYINIKYNKKTIILTCIMSIMLLTTYYLNILVLNILALIVVIMYAVVNNKTIIKPILNKAKNMIK